MKKSFIILLLAVLPLFSFAQNVISLGEYDYVETEQTEEGTLYLFKKVDDTTYKKIGIDIYFSDVSENESDTENIDKEEFLKYKTIAVQAIDALPPAEWQTLLEGKMMVLNTEGDSSYSFSMHTPSLISFALKDNLNYDVIFCDYFLLKVANQKYILVASKLYPKYDLGYEEGEDFIVEHLIIPTKDNWQVEEYVISRDAKSKNDEFDRPAYQAQLLLDRHFKIEYSESEKDTLLDYWGNTTNITGDMIAIEPHYIVAINNEEDQQYSFYNKSLTKIRIEGKVRALGETLRTSAIALIGNNIEEVQLADLADYEEDIFEPDAPEMSYKYSIGKNAEGKYTVTSKGKHFTEDTDDLFEYLEMATINDSENEIDSISFCYGNMEIISFNALEDVLIFVKKKDGKYNVCYPKHNFGDNSYELIDQLADDCDSMQKSPTFLFSQNNKMGYYPLMQNAHFKTIELKEHNFARYEDFYGEQGWIHLITGEALPDL